MASGEVEPDIWRAAVRAARRYFDGLPQPESPLGRSVRAAEKLNFRTGYIMGMRAGKRTKK